MINEKLPQWAKDRLEAEAKMGKMETHAPIGFSLGVVAILTMEVVFFLISCVIIYWVGKAVLGP